MLSGSVERIQPTSPSSESLYEGYVKGEPDSYADTYDSKVYNHYLEAGKQATGVKETLARILHDRSMNDALNDFIRNYNEKDIIGIMGGHGLLRSDESYRKVALLSKHLTEKGCLMVSGGGPGAMEATHLGAWLAGKDCNRDFLDCQSDGVDRGIHHVDAAPQDLAIPACRMAQRGRCYRMAKRLRR